MSGPAEAPPLAPPAGPCSADTVLERFLAVVAAKGLSLYPEQEEAILELFAGANVVLNTPTGSGKSLVATAFLFKALCAGERSVYTCPIKALVNEKFLSLCRDFGPERVGMMTGDASVNPRAPILCCTAEILANIALHRGPSSDLRAVVMDEFHYYSDPERGYAWQVPLLTMERARLLLMSATLPDTVPFERAMTRLNGAPSVAVRSDRRPVPLEFEYSETPLAERVQALLDGDRAPVYLVHFTQRSAAETAQDLMSLAVCDRAGRAALDRELEGERFGSPYGKEMRRWLRHGIGVHHAGLLPRYRLLVERLAQRGLLRVICGTDTLGVGINVPIRTVLFTQLWKYDGRKAAVLGVRDFRQIAGRAGRRGFDEVGHVIAQAPEHVIANRRAQEKAGGDPKRLRKLAPRRPPEGAVVWDAKTFERLRTAPPEALESRFAITHGMLLLLLGREGDGCRAARRLIADCHESAAGRRRLLAKAWRLFRALLERGIVGVVPPGERAAAGRKLRVAVELQDDFSLHQTLSLYLIDTLALLDPGAVGFPLDVLTLCEAIVEDPDAILRRQVEAARSAKLEELKAAGVEYEERMRRLEDVEHPKPLREFIYETFNAFAARHPWIGEENVRPKSIVRELFERSLSFAEYVRAYGIERSEGLLLRHLSQVWKVLAQTVPEGLKTEPLLELELQLREVVRGVDASLLEEWERLRDPAAAAVDPGRPPLPARTDVTRDAPSFRRLVRAAVFAFLQEVAARDWESAAARLPGADAAALEAAFAVHAAARGRLRLDPAGRAAANSHWSEAPEADELRLAQVLVDADDANDWEARFVVVLAASRAEGRPVVRFESVAPVGR